MFISMASHKEKIQKVKSETIGIQLPKDRLEWKGGGFRNISEETLRIWDAFTWNVPKFENRIILEPETSRSSTRERFLDKRNTVPGLGIGDRSYPAVS